MKISKETFQVLQNFASIQEGLVVDEANVIKTGSIDLSTIAIYDTEETFPVFSIWDLAKFNQLISTLGIDNCDFDFEGSEDFVTITSEKKKIEYGYAEIGTIPVFEQLHDSSRYKDFKVKDGEESFTFNLKSDDINQLRKINNIFNFSEDVLKIEMVDGKGKITVFSEDGEDLSNYEVDIDGEGSGEAFTKIDDMIMISDDYYATVTPKMIQYASENQPLLYFIRTYQIDR